MGSAVGEEEEEVCEWAGVAVGAGGAVGADALRGMLATLAPAARRPQTTAEMCKVMAALTVSRKDCLTFDWRYLAVMLWTQRALELFKTVFLLDLML